MDIMSFNVHDSPVSYYYSHSADKGIWLRVIKYPESHKELEHICLTMMPLLSTFHVYYSPEIEF